MYMSNDIIVKNIYKNKTFMVALGFNTFCIYDKYMCTKLF